MDFNNDLKKEIDQLGFLLEKASEQINRGSSGSLIMRKRHTTHYYEVDENRNIIGGPYKENSSRVLEIKKYHFLKKLVVVLKSNIVVLRKALNGYQPYSPNDINNLLKRTYKCEDFDAGINVANFDFFTNQGSAEENPPNRRNHEPDNESTKDSSGSFGTERQTTAARQASTERQTTVARRISSTIGSGDMNRDRHFNIDTSSGSFFTMPFLAKHVTVDGSFVRSLGEVVIYNALLYNDVDFEYEKSLTLKSPNGHLNEVFPDFTITVPGGQVKYWEHVGMYSDENYRRKFNNKLLLYYENGIVPGSNLILTFSKKDNSVDSREIHRIIRSQIIQ